MGALSNIIAFDFKKFDQEIRPALFEGETNELIKSEIQIRNAVMLELGAASPINYENLSSVMRLFNEDLTHCRYDKYFAVDAQHIYQTTLSNRYPYKGCWTYEDLAFLFESLVIRHCAKYFLSVGKVYRLENVIEANENRTQALIDKWDQGSSIWSHGSGGFAEGIAGWINEQEVKELHELSAHIQIIRGLPYPNDSALNSIKGLLEICASENLGLLYGNDLQLSLSPGFQYWLILKLDRLENENWNGSPTFQSTIVKDYRNYAQL